MKKIIAIQLSKTKSQGNSVFAQAIHALIKDGYHIDMIANPENSSEFEVTRNVDLQIIESGAQLNFFSYLNTQARLFTTVLKMAKAGTPVYIGSASSFGAALAGKIKNANVIYHIEEAPVRPNLMDSLLYAIVNRTASQVILSSAALKDNLALTVKKQSIVYPTVANLPYTRHSFSRNAYDSEFTVGMVAPVKSDSGVTEFFKLAAAMPHINFQLMVTEGAAQLKNFAPKGLNPTSLANISVCGESGDMSTFYEGSSIVVDLSNCNKQINACNTTILQAMQHGKPVIVPAKGATKEFINAKKHGIAVNSDQMQAIVDAINTLNKDQALYNYMSADCKRQAALFTHEHFDKQITSLFKGRKRSVYHSLDQFFGASFFTELSPVSRQQAA